MFTTIQKKRKRATIVCFLKKKNYKARARTFSRGQHCWGSMQTGATLLSQNNRNVGTCWAKSLTGFKLYATSANKCQHCCGSMQTDATSHNIVRPNNVGCFKGIVETHINKLGSLQWVLLANNVASVCTGLKMQLLLN